ncbi:MAG: PstA family ABC transporter permease [Planctomycetota bacterium]
MTSTGRRRWHNALFLGMCVTVSGAALVVLVTLLAAIGVQGMRVIRWSFFTSPPHPQADLAGIGPALMGTLWVGFVCGLIAMPLGVGTGILLEEFKPRSRLGRRLHSFIQLNITNLAGVPSIVYGILGLTAFASMFGLFGSPGDPAFEMGARYYYQYVTEGMNVVFIPTRTPDDVPNLTVTTLGEDAEGRPVRLHVLGPDDPYPQDESVLARTLYPDAAGGLVKRHRWYYLKLPLGRGVLAASLTLMLVILPVIIISSQEALRGVPDTLRQASLGLGATRWQTVRNVSLPSALPGIMTGAILSASRAIGEAAPILMLAGVVYITQAPRHLLDEYSVLPIQIFYWARLPVDRSAAINFQHVAAGGIIVLLAILLTLNGIASYIRYSARKRLS